jgi:aryl-alcohol dehydrogenase-like predicted oxidoreductase
MQFTRLGRTGLKVSRICLGCMTFGVPERGAHAWTLPEEQSRPIIRHAVEQGVNFFDTANSYSEGTSEEFLGRALKEFARRDEVVVATKVFNPMRKGPNIGGLSRKAIFTEIDNSLRRLGMDHVDLYQTHRFDPATPIEETMEALHDVVKAGKARYIGASSAWAWQLATANAVAASHGWTRFVSMQPELSLLYREEEREMLPLCIDSGLGVIPWSPLARGRLARRWGEDTRRIGLDAFGKSLFEHSAEADRRVAEQVARVAAERGVPMAQVAMAWLLRKPGVTAPIVGASKTSHLDDAVAALSLTLSSDEIAALEAPYVPHRVVGFA